ncbi:MAG: hypothetical protein QGF46_02615 [Planctomycetota bacterium]|jgi:hypothetical protein|nr:hypothetical protein [Planctomycetota bacterium]
MATAQRFGLAFGLGKKSKFNLNQAFGDRLDEVRSRFAKILDADIAISEDGLNGSVILNSSSNCFDLAVALQEAAWPAPLQHAVVSAPPAGAAGQDQAVRDKALKTLSKMKKYQVLNVVLPSKSANEIAMANSIADLHRTIVLNFTETRLAAVRAYRKNKRQADVAAAMQVSQQAVSQMILGARWKQLKAAEQTMRDWLEQPQRTMLWPMKGRG